MITLIVIKIVSLSFISCLCVVYTAFSCYMWLNKDTMTLGFSEQPVTSVDLFVNTFITLLMYFLWYLLYTSFVT